MFNDNRYNRIYDRLIERARYRSLVTYIERHHIIPRSLGGTDAKDNIVSMPAREHYIAHLCLVRMTEGLAKQKMVFAANWLAGQHRCHINSRVYQSLKEQKATQMVGNHYNDGRAPWSLEMRQYFSQTMRGKQNSLGRIDSSATCEKKRQAQILRHARTGGRHLPEVIEKMRVAQRARWAQRKEVA